MVTSVIFLVHKGRQFIQTPFKAGGLIQNVALVMENGCEV